MIKYIFIIGKNWLLSLSELNHFLKRDKFKGKITDYSACAAIIEFDKGELGGEEIANLIFALGGTLKICKVLDFIDLDSFYNAFPEKIDSSVHPGIMIDARRHVKGIIKDLVYPTFGGLNIYKGTKFFIANSIYPISFDSRYYKTLVSHFLPFLNKYWMEILSDKGIKNASYYNYPKENVESGNLNPIFPHHFFRYELYRPTRKEIVYTLTEDGMYIGYTINVTNSNEMKMMDEERPFKNPKGSIPPKFAKIMVNFLNLKRPYGTRRILDPFCGTGTILLFAYSQGIGVWGADTDKRSSQGTKNNLRWLQEFLEKPLKINLNKNVINAEINTLPEKFGKIKFDGAVTEPILLRYFTELPKYNEIDEIINNHVIPTYLQAFRVFNEMLKPGARVVITSPSVLTLDGGRIRVNLNKIADNFNFQKISVLDKADIIEKSGRKLALSSKKNVIFDSGTKYFRREFYIFEKNP